MALATVALSHICSTPATLTALCVAGGAAPLAHVALHGPPVRPAPPRGVGEDDESCTLISSGRRPFTVLTSLPRRPQATSVRAAELLRAAAEVPDTHGAMCAAVPCIALCAAAAAALPPARVAAAAAVLRLSSHAANLPALWQVRIRTHPARRHVHGGRRAGCWKM